MKFTNPKITLRGFKPDARGAGHVLGELETAVMELLWREAGQTATDVAERLRKKRDIAHTTVQTTLDRMYRKNYLTRVKEGKAFVYAPRYTREEFDRGVAQEVLGALLGQFTGQALSAFVELVSEDGKALDQLEEMIRQKRRAQVKKAGSK